LGKSKVAALDLAARYREMSEDLRKLVCERIDDEYGLDVPSLFIVNISLPEAVEKALDTRSSIGVVGDMNQFQQYQMGQAMLEAAKNPGGGGAAEGMGLGIGFAMANRMAGAGAGTTIAPPPPPMAAAWYVAAAGQTRGPLTAEQLMQAIAAGQVTAASQVWTAGMTGWTTAGQVPQLVGAFGAVPPPPPPA
jgi:membrane protease subunit (stomatin/prohibitin family)